MFTFVILLKPKIKEKGFIMRSGSTRKQHNNNNTKTKTNKQTKNNNKTRYLVGKLKSDLALFLKMTAITFGMTERFFLKLTQKHSQHKRYFSF